MFCINKVWCSLLRFIAPICRIWLEKWVCGELSRRKAPKFLQALFNFVSRHYFDSQRKKLGLILFVTNMASLGHEKVGADQVLGPEFLVIFTVSSFSIDRYSFQQSFKCNTYGDKNVLRLGNFCGQLGPKSPKLAQLTMQFWLVSVLATI